MARQSSSAAASTDSEDSAFSTTIANKGPAPAPAPEGMVWIPGGEFSMGSSAFGNSDGDLQMLQWTAAGPGARFCLFVRHTDAEREWKYDVTPLGRFEKGLDEAKAKGWTVVDMKDDWKTIFPPAR